MATYFYLCTTPEEAKAEYKKLYQQHRDQPAIMQDINAQFAAFIAPPAPTTPPATPPACDLIEKAAKLQAISQDITVEVNGKWIWVTGDTKPVHEQLSAAGCRFAFKKKAWYYHTMKGFRSKNRLTQDQIRARYGSEQISNN